MDVLLDRTVLPHPSFAAAWQTIKLPETVKPRLLAQSLLSLQLRQHYSFEEMPIHGLIMLQGVPGTGKTTLARGLANEVSKAIKKATFVQLDAHALGSASLGKSQKEVAKVFNQTIPELAATTPAAIVLLDEVETLAADRQRMSLETNPVDAHRATDAALSGIDLLCRTHRNTLLIATTNYPKAVDRALLSRADWIEDIGTPSAEIRKEIILDVIDLLSRTWPTLAGLKGQIAAFVRASEGMDGRRLRKAMMAAGAISVEVARDLNRLKAEHIVATLKQAAAQPDMQEGTA